MPARIIAVVGATGAQGGGLVNAILNDPSGAFRARALTRKPDGEAARALARRGAEVAVADMDDTASLTRAFTGADALFAVTNFWEHFSVEREQAQVRALATAAKAAGVRHVIWSTLEDTRRWVPLSDNRMPTLQGKYKVPHFDGKGEADQYFRDAGVPTTFLLTSFYWDNFIYFGAGPKPGPDGTLLLTLPIADAPLSGIAAEDIGQVAYALFRQGAPSIGRAVAIAGEHLTGELMAASMTRALSRTVKYNPVSPEVYRSFGFPGADDLGNMFQFYRDFTDYFTGVRDVAAARALYPGLQTFDQWLARYASKIPLE
jgi:uncharacterized protein YbjT (DUF2867 family)